MQIQVLFFGITSDIVGKRKEVISISKGMTIEKLKEKLLRNYPKLQNYANFSMALNTEYANSNLILKNGDVVALIPPVSGG